MSMLTPTVHAWPMLHSTVSKETRRLWTLRSRTPPAFELDWDWPYSWADYYPPYPLQGFIMSCISMAENYLVGYASDPGGAMFASPALGYVRVNYGNSMGYAVALDAPIDSLILTAGLQSGYLSWFSRETGQCIRCEIPSIAFGHTWPVSESLFQTRCYAYDDRRRYVYKMSYQYPGFQSLTLQVVQCNPMHLTFGELEDPLSGNIIDPALKGGQIAFVKGATKDLDKVFVVNPLGPQLFHICYPEQPFGGIPWEPFGPVASGHSQLFYAPTTCAAAPNGVLMTSADGSTGYSKFTDAVTGALLADSATGSFGGNSRAVPFLWAAYNPCSGCIIWNKDTGDSGLYSTDPANGFATNELPGSHGKTYTFVEVDDLSGKIFAMNKNTWSLDIYEQPHNHNQ